MNVSQPNATEALGPLYTTDEVAKLLRVSQRTVQVWIRDGTLPAVRYGRLLRVRQADLATFGESVSGHHADADAADVSSPHDGQPSH
jgi:excisionase family DNA binding protein